MNVMLNGKPVSFDAAVQLMDDDIREDLHHGNFDSDQEFLDAYVGLHQTKYNEDFTVN